MAAPFDRGRRIRLVLWAILAANWGVAAVKLTLGLVSGSAALTADGLHSTVDGGSNVVGLIAMWFAGRPPEEAAIHASFLTVSEVVVHVEPATPHPARPGA